MPNADSASVRRMVENEVVFRNQNEKIERWFSKYKRIARRETKKPTTLEGATPISVFCECSDENCRQRISMTAETYKKLHESDDTFTILCGHEVAGIEDIVAKEEDYCVVKKHYTPPKQVDKLKSTDVDNS